jgi:hypothetical protein
MRKIIGLTLLIASSSAFAEYNPFLAVQPNVPVVNVEPGAPQVQQEKPADVNPADLLDKELKGLLNEISARDEQDKAQAADVTEYIATTNCVDIYYHTIEKRYEERKSKACIQSQAKEKIIQEIHKNEANQKKVTGK